MRVLFTLAVLALASCDSIRELDQAQIYKGPKFELVLVRFYKNYPLHFSGATFNVQCKSVNTLNSKAHDERRAGWAVVGGNSALDSESALQLLEEQRKNYIVVDDDIVVRLSPDSFAVSFDACGSSNVWNVSSLPAEFLAKSVQSHVGYVPTSYDNIKVSANGQIQFTALSAKFADSKVIEVESTDFGDTWRVRQRIDGGTKSEWRLIESPLSQQLFEMNQLGIRASNGESGTLEEIKKMREQLYLNIDYTNDKERVLSNLKLMNAAFRPIGVAAGDGNERALEALFSLARSKDMQGFVIKAFGIAAARGNNRALEALLNYEQYGWLLTSVVSAMAEPAAVNNPEAVSFLVKINEEDSAHTFWYLYALALEKAAYLGNEAAAKAMKSSKH
jgi:hypothetical protein